MRDLENRKYNKRTHTAAERGAFNADKLIDKSVFDALASVFIDGAYCQKAITDALKTLKDSRQNPFVTSAFYGVLDKNVRLEKIISSLCDKTPDKTSAVVLKIGLYYLGYANIPDYAAVNRTVELSKQLNGVYSGFINAVLKKSIGFSPKFKSKLEEFSYEHCAPEWLCKSLISDYGETRARSILDAVIPPKTHVRPISGMISRDSFFRAASGLTVTDHGCYCDKSELSRFDDGTVVAQSLSSIIAANTYADGIDGGSVLDLCAAPGGKSVYIAEKGNYKITSCDIYPHKVELIKKLARKCGVKLNAVLNDATVENQKFFGAFDLVIADCPCSGTGTLRTKPDVMLNRKPSDIADLNAIQKKILDVGAKYCKVGGVLCYSTCSVLKSENERIKEAFLKDHSEYTLKDERKLLPDSDNCDGFYIARFERVK